MFKRFAAQLLDKIADDCDEKAEKIPEKRDLLDKVSCKITGIINALVELDRDGS